ncbi:MAG TPA: hypothetical protein VIQ03_09040 [Gammaproteobacteria bacterium]
MKETIFTALLVLSTINFVFADERKELEGISIIGNRELPNILYIVPWKSPGMPDMMDIPLTTLINQSLEPIDRLTVIREEQYYNALKSNETAQQE